MIPISISRMETYARCPFAQLVRYGLRPRERKQFSLRAPDIGDYLHGLLERYGRRVEKEKMSWQELQQTECERIIEEVLAEVPEDYGGGIFEATGAGRYLRRRLHRMFALSAWMLTCQIGRGDYIPWSYELDFGRFGELPPVEVALEDGSRVLLEGRIDRVDLRREEDTVWLRIIDYKTGAKEFRLSDLYYGIGIQLALYAVAMLKGWAKRDSRAAKLAGMFFFRLDDPWLDEKSGGGENPESAMLKKFRLKGLLLQDQAVIRKMDRELTASSTSDIIPAALLKDESLSAKTMALPPEEMQVLFDYVQFWLRQNAGDMLAGACPILPAADGRGMNACSFCQYHAICQFDPELKDNQYRWLQELPADAALGRMQQALQRNRRAKTEEEEV